MGEEERHWQPMMRWNAVEEEFLPLRTGDKGKGIQGAMQRMGEVGRLQQQSAARKKTEAQCRTSEEEDTTTDGERLKSSRLQRNPLEVGTWPKNSILDRNPSEEQLLHAEKKEQETKKWES